MRYLPSTTEVISPWSDFSKIPPGVLQAAADRGTAVHDVCLNFHAKGLPFIGTIQDDAKGYIASFDYWFEKMVAEVILVEERLFDEAFQFHGQIDLLVRLENTQVLLVDLKTPVSLQRSWKIQLSAYRHLCTVAGHRVDLVGSLQLSPEGKMAKMVYYTDSAKDFNIFIQCLQVFKFFNS